jgi:hypothetical protein
VRKGGQAAACIMTEAITSDWRLQQWQHGVGGIRAGAHASSCDVVHAAGRGSKPGCRNRATNRSTAAAGALAK